MKRILNIVFVLLGLILASCDQIFETDISKKSVSLIAPTDSARSPFYNTSFWWESVDGAINYNLQVVRPSFNNMIQIVLDTNIKATKFSFTLSPGDYQWRVRAQNGSSNTVYSTRTLTVDTAALTDQSVNLVNPDLGAFKPSTIAFKWQSLFGANKYIFQVDSVSGNFSGSPTQFVLDTTIDNLNQNIVTRSFYFNKEGSYLWRVKASDGTKYSQFSKNGTFIIDKTSPSTPTNLINPTGARASSNITLTWNNATDNLSGVGGYNVFVYYLNATDTIPVTNFNPHFVLAPSSGNPSDVFQYPSPKTIVWKVQTVDKASNVSGFSTRLKFDIGN